MNVNDFNNMFENNNRTLSTQTTQTPKNSPTTETIPEKKEKQQIPELKLEKGQTTILNLFLDYYRRKNNLGNQITWTTKVHTQILTKEFSNAVKEHKTADKTIFNYDAKKVDEFNLKKIPLFVLFKHKDDTVPIKMCANLLELLVYIGKNNDKFENWKVKNN